MSKIATFGEIMLRLSSPNGERLSGARMLNVVYGGAEANVAVSLARYGDQVRYVTRMPADNPLTDGCIQQLNRFQVDTEHVAYGGERFGVYFIDTGSGPRPTYVTYDRANSGFASLEPGMIDWSAAFDGITHFHWSGISPAVSESAAAATAEAVDAASNAGITISCDLNYRHKLWQYGKRPHEIMPSLLEKCHVLVGNSAKMMIDVDQPNESLSTETASGYLKPLADRFPNLDRIVMTCRNPLDNGNETLSAVMWHNGDIDWGRQIEIHGVADPIGSGDAFSAGLIHGLIHFADDRVRVLNFATAAAVLKQTTFGDVNIASEAEVQTLADARDRFSILR